MLAINIELSDNGEATLIQPSIAIIAQEVTPDNFTGLVLSIAASEDGSLGNDALSSDRPPTASVDVPDTLLQTIPGADRVALSVQTNSTFYIQSPSAAASTIPITFVISLDVIVGNRKAEVTDADPPITFEFSLQSAASSGRIRQCRFWNASKQYEVILSVHYIYVVYRYI